MGIIAWLFVLVIVLFVIGGQFKGLYEKAFGEKGIVTPITEEKETAVTKGATKTGVPITTTEISKDHDKAVQEISTQILKCYNYMVTGKIQNYRHANLKIPYVTPGIKKQEVIAQVRKYDAFAAETLFYDWDRPDAKGDILTTGTYLLCCDYDSADYDDIFLTKQTSYGCEG